MLRCPPDPGGKQEHLRPPLTLGSEGTSPDTHRGSHPAAVKGGDVRMETPKRRDSEFYIGLCMTFM